jgi:hypothetical protein
VSGLAITTPPVSDGDTPSPYSAQMFGMKAPGHPSHSGRKWGETVAGTRTTPKSKEWSHWELKGEWQMFHWVEYFSPTLMYFIHRLSLVILIFMDCRKRRVGEKSCRATRTAPGTIKTLSNKQRR